jgi:hypothetical protein
MNLPKKLPMNLPMTLSMNRAGKICFASAGATLAALFVVIVFAFPAQAAEPIFPAGSLIGLVPPAGMVTSRGFTGFEDTDKNAGILIATLPPSAYSEIEKSLNPDALKKQGMSLEKREPMQFSFGNGFLIVAKQTTDKGRYHKWLAVAATDKLTTLVSVQTPEQDTTYSDKVVRETLATLALRTSVPDTEKLSLLPFTIGDMANFRIGDVVPGRAVMLLDGNADATQEASNEASRDALGPGVNARMLIFALAGGPNGANDRMGFARLAFDQIGGIKDVRITMSEPLRIGGQSGFETVAEAKEAQSGDGLMVVQWLRFGNGGFLRMVGIVRAGIWNDVFTRLRTVRDNVDPK